MNAKAFVIPAIFRAIDDFSRPIRTMQRNVSNLERSMRKASMWTNNMYKGLGGNYGTVALSAGLYGIANGFVDVAKAAADAEMSIAGFTPMMGSAAKAQQLFNELQQFAVKSPYVYSDLGTAASSFLPMVKGDIKQVMELMNMVGEISGGKSDRLTANAVNLSQIIGKGKPDMIDMKQFATQLVPMYQMLEKSMGIEAAKIQASFHTGKKQPGELTIRSADIIQALKVATSEGGMYFNAMSLANKTLEGQMNALNEQWRLTKMTIGLTFLPLLKDYAHEAIGIALKIKDWAVANKELISQKMNGWLTSIASGIRFLIRNFETILTLAKYWAIALVAAKTLTIAFTLATRGAQLATFLWNISLGINNALLGRSAFYLMGNVVAYRTYRAIVVTVTAVQNLFNVSAGIAVGILGGVIALLAVGAYSWHKYSEAQQESNKVTQRAAENTAKLQSDAKYWIRQLRVLKEGTDGYNSTLKALESISPGIIEQFQLQKKNIDNIAKAERELIAVIMARGRVQAAMELGGEAQREAIAIRANPLGYWDSFKAKVLGIDPSQYKSNLAKQKEKQAERFYKIADMEKINLQERNSKVGGNISMDINLGENLNGNINYNDSLITPRVKPTMGF